MYSIHQNGGEEGDSPSRSIISGISLITPKFRLLPWTVLSSVRVKIMVSKRNRQIHPTADPESEVLH